MNGMAQQGGFGPAAPDRHDSSFFLRTIRETLQSFGLGAGNRSRSPRQERNDQTKMSRSKLFVLVLGMALLFSHGAPTVVLAQGQHAVAHHDHVHLDDGAGREDGGDTHDQSHVHIWADRVAFHGGVQDRSHVRIDRTWRLADARLPSQILAPLLEPPA